MLQQDVSRSRDGLLFKHFWRDFNRNFPLIGLDEDRQGEGCAVDDPGQDCQNEYQAKQAWHLKLPYLRPESDLRLFSHNPPMKSTVSGMCPF